MLATFDALAAWTSEHGPRGCAFVNASGELADPRPPTPGHPAHRITREHKAWLREHLRDLAAVVEHTHPDELAGQLLALHEGATVLYSVGADPDAAATARRAAATLLASDARRLRGP